MRVAWIREVVVARVVCGAVVVVGCWAVVRVRVVEMRWRRIGKRREAIVVCSGGGWVCGGEGNAGWKWCVDRRESGRTE